MIAKTDKEIKTMTGDSRESFLTMQSNGYAIDTLNAYKKLALELITKMTEYCELNFKTDENL